MTYDDSELPDANLLREIAQQLEDELEMSGLSSGLYFEWAAEIAMRFHAAKVSADDNQKLNERREKWLERRSKTTKRC